MRLIDADALKKSVPNTHVDIFENCGNCELLDDEQVEELIDDAPTIDAVPVVRCKDCKWWTKQEKSIQGRCALAGIYPTGGWYCANGERRYDETD